MAFLLPHFNVMWQYISKLLLFIIGYILRRNIVYLFSIFLLFRVGLYFYPKSTRKTLMFNIFKYYYNSLPLDKLYLQEFIFKRVKKSL